MHDLAESADANFVVHVTTVQRRLSGASVQEERELVVVDSGLPCDTFNFVCRARLAPDGARARARRAMEHFRAVGRPFSWWVGPGDRPEGLGDLLVELGLARAETELAMAVDLEKLPPALRVPEELRIARVSSPAELRDFARVNAANWTPPDPHVIRFYELGRDVLLEKGCPLWLYVGYLEGAAVATAEMTVGGGVVGLYGISTLEAHRRRGFGSAVTLKPLLDARERGQAAAVLQASPDGVGLYERIGFEPFGSITEYKPQEERP